MVLGIKEILSLCLLIHFSLSEDFIEFLVEGETVEFTQQIRTDRLTIITVIDIDAVSGR